MEVSVPRTLEEALEILAADPKATILAGGTDLLVGINFGRDRPEHVVATRQLTELKELSADGQVVCGAGVTYTRMVDVVPDRALLEAARTIGSPQIRNAGTLGGNLGTCSPAGDGLTVLAALEATVSVASRHGLREVPFEGWMHGPRQPELSPGELIRDVRWASAGLSQAFLKAGTRNAMVIAVANLAMVVDRQRRRVRVALGSVGPTIIRTVEAEEFAAGLFEESGWERPLRASQAALARFGELVGAAAKPIEDQRGTVAYRRHIVEVMARRALARTGAVA